MEQEQQSFIVCATRGGQGSRAVQGAAVRYAASNNSQLIFLYVVDDTQYPVDEVLRPALRAEMLWLGRTLLQLALRRGALQGVAADLVILEGNTESQILAYVREHRPDILFLGAPRGTTPYFGDDQIEKFAVAVESDTQTRVELIRPEAVPSGD